MNKLLVLGSDFVTIEVVREAKKTGIYVIVSDMMETSPSKELADEAWMISTTDIDTLENKCREVGITGVMFGASDFNITNARILCKRLGLPIYCDDDNAWRAARDKSYFKEICKRVGAPVATDYYLTDDLTQEELSSVTFPVVVKPVDKSGNRGMSYCDNCEELVMAYKKARDISDNSKIIVERRLNGTEFNVNYTCADGEINLTCFSILHHEPGQLSNLYSFETSSPLYLKQWIEEVNESLIAAFKEAGCREGIVWVDAIRDDQDGKFYLLEMGYRFPGAMLNVPYKKIYGFSSVKWMIECALGVKHKVNDLPTPLNEALSKCAGSLHLFTDHAGKIGKISGLEEVMNLPGVSVDMPKREGGEVRAYACVGLMGFYGENMDEMCDSLRKVNELLRIEDEDGKNLIIKYDDYETLRKEFVEGISDFIV